jgi:hypothetical protein
MYRNFAWKVRDFGLQNTLDKDYRTYGTQAHNGTRNEFRGTLHPMLSQFFISFALPASPYCAECVCVYIHISDCVQTVYELPLLLNNTIVKHFYTNLGRWEVLTGYLSLGAPAWRWLGEYVTLDRTFYSLLFKQEAVAAPVTATFTSVSHSLRGLLSEI